MPDHLIDTHVFIWALSAPENLSEVARGIVEDPESATFVSAISAYEIVLKHRLGKLGEAAGWINGMSRLIVESGFDPLPVTFEQAQAAASFTDAHRDPFDRMLAAQANSLGLVLVSRDEKLDLFTDLRRW
jgi:PIN domain nuclease of toxin-antitoxin system